MSVSLSETKKQLNTLDIFTEDLHKSVVWQNHGTRMTLGDDNIYNLCNAVHQKNTLVQCPKHTIV